MTGCIQISGAWQGAVILQCSEGFARNAASRMLCLEDEDITSADIQDSFAELTNMIGGNKEPGSWPFVLVTAKRHHRRRL